MSTLLAAAVDNAFKIMLAPAPVAKLELESAGEDSAGEEEVHIPPPTPATQGDTSKEIIYSHKYTRALSKKLKMLEQTKFTNKNKEAATKRKLDEGSDGDEGSNEEEEEHSGTDEDECSQSDDGGDFVKPKAKARQLTPAPPTKKQKKASLTPPPTPKKAGARKAGAGTSKATKGEKLPVEEDVNTDNSGDDGVGNEEPDSDCSEKINVRVTKKAAAKPKKQSTPRGKASSTTKNSKGSTSPTAVTKAEVEFIFDLASAQANWTTICNKTNEKFGTKRLSRNMKKHWISVTKAHALDGYTT